MSYQWYYFAVAFIILIFTLRSRPTQVSHTYVAITNVLVRRTFNFNSLLPLFHRQVLHVI